MASYKSLFTDAELPIAADGDITIDVDILPPLRVSSAVLMQASPVLKDMLEPSFQEDQKQYNSATPKHISLPDVDATLLTSFCQVLHDDCSSYLLLTRRCEFSYHIAEIAILADKYNAIPAVKRAARDAIERFAAPGVTSQLPFKVVAELATAAYLFGWDNLLRLFTRCMIMDHNDCLSTLKHTVFFKVVPTRAILILSEQQAGVRNDFLTLVNQLATAYCNKCQVEHFSPQFGLDIAAKLEPASSRWPPDFVFEENLRSAFEALHELRNYELRIDGTKVSCGSEDLAVSYTAATMRDATNILASFVYGLCLPCTKGDEELSKCRHEHKHYLKIKDLLMEIDPIVPET